MATKETVKTESKGLPTAAKVGIGCFIFLALVGIGLSTVGHFLFSRFGVNLMKKGIEQKTGVSIDMNKGGEGIVYKDKKTGAEVSIGQGKVPADFPKDFPLYANATLAGNASGMQEGKKGYWLIFTSKDSADAVVSFYEDKLKSSGWSTDETMSLGALTTLKVAKNGLVGTVTITTDEAKKDTSIMVTLAAEDGK